MKQKNLSLDLSGSYLFHVTMFVHLKDADVHSFPSNGPHHPRIRHCDCMPICLDNLWCGMWKISHDGVVVPTYDDFFIDEFTTMVVSTIVHWDTEDQYSFMSFNYIPKVYGT